MDNNIKNKLFTKKSFIETQIWIYGSFAGISFAFFLALLGVNGKIYKQTITQIIIFVFSISLVTNAFIAFIFSIFRDDGNLIHSLNLNSKINYIIWIACGSFILGVILTTGIFSKFMMCFSVILGGFLYFVFIIAMKEIRDKAKEEHEIEMDKIIKGEIG